MIPTNASEAVRGIECLAHYLDWLLSAHRDPRRQLDYMEGGFLRNQIDGALATLSSYEKFLDGEHRELHRRIANDLYVQIRHAMPRCKPGIH